MKVILAGFRELLHILNLEIKYMEEEVREQYLTILELIKNFTGI